MLRITTSVSGEGATRYFDVALARSDYYTSEYGIWGGKGAERLGLRDEVEREDFVALVSNEMPGTKENLTPRTKEKRRAGYDFTFSVPKSVSIYLAETGDKRLERMIHESFRKTMGDVEDRMEARVRRDDQDYDRTTGNMVYASFVHRETRPIDGIPDPHWHIHAYVMNATFDEAENRWKAGQFGNIKADAPFYEAAFNARLADKLIKAGYGIRRTDRDFELASVSGELIEKFSKRTKQIEKIAREQHTVIEARARYLAKTTGMDFADAFAVEKSKIGSRNREKKSAATLGADEQLANWRSQMTPAERESLQMDNVKGTSQNLLEVDSAKDLTVLHLFERSSVTRELHAAGMLLRRGIGRVSVEAARMFVKLDGRFVRANVNGHLVTTRETLAEEEAMIRTARAGQGTYQPIGRGKEQLARDGTKLSDEQSTAIHRILESTDLVTTLHGPAGSGKTTLMREAVSAVESLSGRQVIVLAPSSSAVEVLKGEGFTRSETFQAFQKEQLLQAVGKGQMLWVDEAGFLSMKQMRWLLDFAAREGCRVILSGDTRQHHSVDRGDALRVLENCGAVTIAALSRIIRQRIEPLRDAVTDLSQGRTGEGFDKLNAYGAVHEVENKEERLAAIAELHLAARARGDSSLIVAPTHAECRAIADVVRDREKKEGSIGPNDIFVSRLAKLNLTESQRSDVINYEPGQVVQFDRRAKGGFKAGEQWTVGRVRSEGVEVQLPIDGKVKLLPLDQAASFNVYTIETMPLAAGDMIRITKNFQANGHKFRNNELVKVKEIGIDNIIRSTDRRSLHGNGTMMHIDQGVAVTSHAAQGKTVDHVIASTPVQAFSQVNQAQLYVTMSRARVAMHLLTNSIAALREAVCRKSDRLSALELSNECASMSYGVDLQAGKRGWEQWKENDQAPERTQEWGIER